MRRNNFRHMRLVQDLQTEMGAQHSRWGYRRGFVAKSASAAAHRTQHTQRPPSFTITTSALYLPLVHKQSRPHTHTHPACLFYYLVHCVDARDPVVRSSVFPHFFFLNYTCDRATDCCLWGTWRLLLCASAKEVRGLRPTHYYFLTAKPRERGVGTAVEGVGMRGGIFVLDASLPQVHRQLQPFLKGCVCAI